jgi:hypothetical protein
VNSFNLFILMIEFSISENALITRRTINKSFMTVSSAILGSIAGLLTIIGKAMANSEKLFNRIKAKINAKKRFLQISQKRKDLKNNMSDEETAQKTDISFTFADVPNSTSKSYRVNHFS